MLEQKSALSPPAEAAPGERRRPRTARGLLRACRPQQWPKNTLVFAAPLAAGAVLEPGALRLVWVLLLFVAASSAVYLVNDCLDAEADRRHPVKRARPIAAGEVPVPLALGLGVLLGVLAPVTAFLVCNPATGVLLGTYVLVQVAYCVWLKHVVIADLAVVSSGFLMRAVAGGVALGIPLSRWFLTTTGFCALFAVAAKRYSETVTHRGSSATRDVIHRYTDGYLRFVWQLAAAVSVLSYCLWALDDGTVLDGTSPLWRQLSTVPFILAVLRYAMFADRGAAEAPEKVVRRDRPLCLLALAWLLLYGTDLLGL